ncbi:MAG: hypothetical protein M3334_12590 [Actinomycetota bacterium]|nr:hypothetical protein [Actinomycetota bacterium]
MHDDQHAVAGHPEVLLDVVGPVLERQVVGRDGVLWRQPRCPPVADIQDRSPRRSAPAAGSPVAPANARVAISADNIAATSVPRTVLGTDTLSLAPERKYELLSDQAQASRRWWGIQA